MFTLLIKLLFIGGLLVSSFSLYTSPLHWIFMSWVNLIFHEAGHAIFFVFGNFMHALGGTLGELLIPLAIIFHFLKQGNRYALGFSLWWLSTALYNVSVYVADAGERALPLITGDPGTHDWWFLLNELGLINYDNFIGTLFFLLSLGTFGYAIMVFFKDIKSGIGSLMAK